MKKTVLTAPIAALLLLSCAEAPQEKGKEITYTPQAAYNPPTYVCYKAPAPIKIDGKLSPEEWDAIPWTPTLSISKETNVLNHFCKHGQK